MDPLASPESTDGEALPADWSVTEETGSVGERAAFGPDAEPSPSANERSAEEIEDAEASQLRAQYLDAETVNVASSMQQVIHNYYNRSSGAAPSGISTLAIDRFEVIEGEQVERVAAEILCEAGWVDSSVSSLKRNRIVVILGRRELGKATAALHVAANLRRRESFRSILLARGLERTLRVSLREVAGGSPAFKGCLVILKNALANENDDLLRWLRELDQVQLETLREQLAKSGNFLILTSGPEKLKEVEGSLRTLGLVADLPSPTPEMLGECLRRQLARVLRSPSLADAALRDEVVDRCGKDGPELALQLGTLPRIVRFAEGYLTEMTQGRQSIEEALARFDSPEHWLLDELPGDVEAWAAVLALVLCSAPPLLRSVPWLQFDRTRRDLADYIRRAVHRDREPRDSRDVSQARSVLERARIAIVPSPEPAGVVFRADLMEKTCQFSDRLWQVLVGTGNEVLAFLLPFLVGRLGDRDPYVRPMAVRALGRAGAIDPSYVLSPLLNEWAEAKDPERQEKLGLLFEGLLGSDDARYRELGLGRLRRLSTESAGNAGRTAIRTFAQIGALAPEVAVKALREIAAAKARFQADLLDVESRKLARVEALLLRRGAPEEEIRNLRQVVWSRLGKLLVEDEATLGDLQFVLAAVFVGHPDLEPTLRSIGVWLREGEADLRSVLSCLLLADPGLLSLLESQRRAIRFEGGGSAESCSPFLAFCWQRQTGLEISASFLEGIFRSTGSFPALFQRYLRERFAQFLTGWIQEGARVKPLRATVVELMARLYRSSDTALRDVLHQALRRHDVAANEGAQAVAVEVLTYRPPAALKGPPSLPGAPSEGALS